MPIEAADQLGGGLKEILRAMHSTWEPLTEVREMMQRQHDLLLGVGALSALGSVAGGMSGFVSAAGDIGALGRQSEIRALGINSAEMLRAFMPPSAYLESETLGATLRSIADFGSLDRLSRSFIPDIEPFRSAWPAPSRRAPAVPHAPEPPAEQIEVVQTDDPLTLESLDRALAEGRLSWREVMRLARQNMPATKRGKKEPPIPEQLSLVTGWYAVRGKMLQQMYCDKAGISKASLNRYERTCKAYGLI